MFADFEKAFDSLHHDFIIECFKQFNFGEDIIKWIKLFCNNISSLIVNNGNISQSFDVQRGVRQGCPLSSTIFVICIEILANCIEHNENIKGISIGDRQIKQSLFADDATFFNNGDETSFGLLLKTTRSQIFPA